MDTKEHTIGSNTGTCTFLLYPQHTLLLCKYIYCAQNDKGSQNLKGRCKNSRTSLKSHKQYTVATEETFFSGWVFLKPVQETQVMQLSCIIAHARVGLSSDTAAQVHPCSCDQPPRIYMFNKLTWVPTTIILLVCQQRPIWEEQTFVHLFRKSYTTT